MSDLQLILFDDERARDWFPFTETRPAGELLHGAFTMRGRAERLFAARCVGHVTAPHLAEYDEPGAPPVVALNKISTEAPRLFLSSRAIPPWDAKLPSTDKRISIRVGGQPAGMLVAAGEKNPTEAQLAAANDSAADLGGTMLGNVWDLVSRNAAQTAVDIAGAGKRTGVPSNVGTVGKGAMVLGVNVKIEPNVVFDFSDGPIWLDDNVTIRSFTRLSGPSFVGANTTLLGGPYAHVSIGPWCKIHGEVEASVILGYSNKAHDGFLGHAYLGRWVNLGALTTNSDLKNNYGNVRLWTPRGEVDTGEMKIGSLLGDHVKTAIGTMINTGTVVGPGSNLFGGKMPPKFVPPFSWGDDAYEYDKFIATAGAAMKRRNVELTDKQRAQLRAAWERGRKLASKK